MARCSGSREACCRVHSRVYGTFCLSLGSYVTVAPRGRSSRFAALIMQSPLAAHSRAREMAGRCEWQTSSLTCQTGVCNPLSHGLIVAESVERLYGAARRQRFSHEHKARHNRQGVERSRVLGA